MGTRAITAWLTDMDGVLVYEEDALRTYSPGSTDRFENERQPSK